MKKRLLSALLALALVFVLLPTTALAEVVSDYFDCDISILGNYWKFEKDSNNEYLPVYYKSEASSFEDSTVAPENNYLEIRKTGEKEITITVHGDVNITATGISIDTIAASKSVIINGNGHLTVKYTWIKSGQNYSAIDVSTLTVEGVALSAEASMGPALSATYGIHIKDGAMVEAKAGYYEAVCEGTGGITIDNATLVSTAIGGGNRSAIKTYGDIAFTNAKVTATNKSSENAAIQAKTYEGKLNHLYVSGTSTITATNQSTRTDTMARAIGATIKNNNTSEKIEVGSSKVDAGKTWYTNAKQVTITSPALEKDSYVYIAGENAVVGQWTNIPAAATGTGSYYYDADKKELTLKDVNITHSDGAIVQFLAGAPYIIKLEGTNSIKDVSSLINVRDAYESLDGLSVTISGAGSLEVIARGNAITMLKGNLIFNNTGAITLETTTVVNGKAINVSGDISIGSDFNKNLRITADNGDMTFDPTNQYTDYNDLKNYKSITIASKPSETYYNDKAMKYGETRNAGSGTISCDENGVITLNGVTKGTLEFRSSADSTLVLEGTNTLSSIVTTQKGLTISGSGSLTAGSIRVPNNTQNTANLTIIGGAHVTVNRPSEDKPAVEVSGNLTVTGDGTQLSAECTAATNPAIEVGGNVTISGNPGTNAYTVKAYNKYDTPRDRVEGLSPSQMPSAIEISGDSLSISNSARVMAKTKSDGAAVWMPALKVISVADASLIAQNSSHNFSTISFGDESNMGNIYAKGQVNIVAENMLGSNSRLAHKAIKAYIYNHYSTGDSNPYYIKVVSEGVQSGGNVNVIPGHHTSTGDYKVTITRGDAYVAPTKTITEIIVTGLTPPVKGATPVDKSKVTLTEGLTVESITWGPAESIIDGKFIAGKSYTAHIKYTVDKGYEFAANAYCPQVNGADVTRWHKEDMPQDEIEVTFHTAADTPTEKPTITLDLPAPVAGVAPVTTGVTATSSDNTPLTVTGVEWYAYTVEYNKTDGNFDRIVKGNKVSGNFEANTYYLAEITFDKSISFANGGLNITAPTWPLEGSWPESCIYRVIENSYTARILFPATGAPCNHVEGPWQSDGQGGQHIKKCTKCGTVMFSEEHSYKYTYESLTTHRVNCGVCGENFVRAHIYTDSYVPTPDGTQHHGKCICGAEETTLRDHVFVNGVCVCGVTQSGGNPTPDVPAAPTGLAGVAPTSANSKDGKITGTTAAMEYATEPNGSNWIECGGDEVTGLSAGTYYVRYKRTTDKPASAVATVVVPAYSGGGEIVPPTPDNPGTIVIIRPAEEEKPAQQPNPSTGANDLVGLAVAAAVAAALGSAALLRKHD